MRHNILLTTIIALAATWTPASACGFDIGDLLTPLGLEEGMTLKFRTNDSEAPHDIIWTVRRVATPVEIWDESLEIPERPVLSEGEEPRWLVRAGESGEIRIYEHLWENSFALFHAIPTELADGRSWQAKRLQAGCGFMVLDTRYVATSEAVTVPAGSFEAFRIEGDSEWGAAERLWIDTAGGLVKFEANGRTYELVSR